MSKRVYSAEIVFVNKSNTLRGFHESRTFHFEAEHERDGFIALAKNNGQVELVNAQAVPFSYNLYETSQLALQDLVAASQRGLK